jgi:hypothetical protein
MTQDDSKPSPMSPQHQAFVRNVAPGGAQPPERNEQEPLGPQPTYDEVLDVAVQYTFPASDPVAVQSACHDVEARERGDEPDRAG